MTNHSQASVKTTHKPAGGLVIKRTATLIAIAITVFASQCIGFAQEIPQGKITESLGFFPVQNPGADSQGISNLLPPKNMLSSNSFGNPAVAANPVNPLGNLSGSSAGENIRFPMENGVVPHAGNNAPIHERRTGYLSDYLKNGSDVKNLEKMVKKAELMKKLHDLTASKQEKSGGNVSKIHWPTVVSYAVFRDKSWAVLQFNDGKTYYAQIGDTLPDHFVIKKIDTTGVILSRGKLKERLAMAPLMGVSDSETNLYNVGQSGGPVPPPPGAHTLPPMNPAFLQGN